MVQHNFYSFLKHVRGILCAIIILVHGTSCTGRLADVQGMKEDDNNDASSIVSEEVSSTDLDSGSDSEYERVRFKDKHIDVAAETESQSQKCIICNKNFCRSKILFLISIPVDYKLKMLHCNKHKVHNKCAAVFMNKNTSNNNEKKLVCPKCNFDYALSHQIYYFSGSRILPLY
ncbi:hypothetical protein [Cardinium endosymbiont of Culicoides punctatus]|uniref:hypothetical protein n=1 Tax=Cardinium endosymbiont of Culicoides punctatus TaxID=2304601 RepID=UPI0010589467|nr:hypothetical protein [Cardinium endosymbiont of Culicoides punctatus]TDG95444.1 hypothetical protein CCPUN_04200 [Cardinium endosymbiont of Culicoides punctatus]